MADRGAGTNPRILLKARYRLKDVRTAIKNKKYHPFASINVQKGITEFGLSYFEALEIVRSLKRNEFQRTVAEHWNHTIWQDSYITTIEGRSAYIKFKILENGVFCLTSFKPDES